MTRNTKSGHAVTLEDLSAEKERGAKAKHDFQYHQISPLRDPDDEVDVESGEDIDEEKVRTNPLLLQSVPALEINIADLTLYLIDRADDLWLIPLEVSLEECERYVQNFSEEFHVISTYLMKIDKREVSFSSERNNEMVRRSIQILKRYMLSIDDRVFSNKTKDRESSPKRKRVRDEVRENTDKNAEKMMKRF